MKTPVNILFASMTGNAECCAIDLGRRLGLHGFSCQSENLASWRAPSLAGKEIALLVVSTWGDGEPPDDVIPFFESLQTLEPGALSGLRYAVFALGDSSYDIFCGFGKNCDRLVEAAGATRIRECECCDLNHDERLPAWAEEIAALIAGAGLETARE